MPQFTIEFTEEALESLTYLRKHEQVAVLDAIESQLESEPVAETRNRKSLRPNESSQWELRVGHLRAFYNVDVESAAVTVVAIGWKEHNKYYLVGRNFAYEDHRSRTRGDHTPRIIAAGERRQCGFAGR